MPVVRKYFLNASFSLVALVVLGMSDSNAQSNPTGLVTTEPGELPIILCAPHGGRQSIPDVPPRSGIGVNRFNDRSDSHTDKLTAHLANALERKLGKRPYVVIARFHRKYVDVNRPAALAFESQNAGMVYDAYHAAIMKARQEVIERWGRGLLLDIHGQASEPNAIYRGTQNGQTVKHLVDRFGRQSLVGESSLFGHLAKDGLRVIPALGSSDRENVDYNGGHTVIKYGSGQSGTLDAIQLELGSQLRATDSRAETAKRLASAIIAFTNEYLPQSEQLEHDDSKQSVNPVMDDAAMPIAIDTQQCDDPNRVFADNFADGDRAGWFQINKDSSTLCVESKDHYLGLSPELKFSSSDSESLKSFATHFGDVRIDKPGDFLKLRFDARHNHRGFVNRGFRFGLFHSHQTRFRADGEFDTSPLALDDNGYFAMIDLGLSTTVDSVVIRETNNATDQRLWKGGRIAFDAADSTPDPLIFARDKRYTYELTLTRNEAGSVDVQLKNNVSGKEHSLTGTSKLTRTRAIDSVYFGVFGSAANFIIDNVTVTQGRTDQQKSRSDKIRVGVYVDKGAGLSVNELLFVLGKFDDVLITRLTADDIRSRQLAGLDLLVQPGGSGGAQGRHLGESGREAIRSFVNDGGGFVGICAGSYVASADYSWSLDILDAVVVDRQHWNRGVGEVLIEFTDAGQELMSADAARLPVLYAQGPLLAPANRPNIDDYEVVASFQTEIAEKGAPKGVMKGTTAIAKGQYGRGRVICFSPHPEMTLGLEKMVYDAIDHVKRKRNATAVRP